jgi:hypothetical protein
MPVSEISSGWSAQELLSLDLPDTEIGSGKDATAYDAAPGIVYRKGHELHGVTDKTEKMIGNHLAEEVRAYASLPQEVQASRTVIAWFSEGRIHKIIERAAGKPLFEEYPAGSLVDSSTLRGDWEESVAIMADVPQKHFNQVVRDETELRDREIYMDYAGSQNLFYDPEVGFTIIDAEFKPQMPLRGRCMYGAFIDVNSLSMLLRHSDTWTGKISRQARNATVTILDKLGVAGHRPKNQLLFGMIREALDYQPLH